MANINNRYTLLDAANAANTELMVPCEDFSNAVFSIDTDGGGDANLTVKFTGSIAEDKPDTSAAQTVTNSYDFIEVTDVEDKVSLDGDTGLVVTGADMHRLTKVEIRGLKWIGVIVTARSQGEVTVNLRLFTNN